MNVSQEAIRQALLLAEQGGKPVLQPKTLMHRGDIDHKNAVGYKQSYLNDAHADTLKGLLDSGYIIFQIQTELQMHGHVTMAYLVKMKAN
jgi:hypothetical protein